MERVTRVCRCCGKRKLTQLFFRNTRYADGYRPECKTCTLKRRNKGK